MSLAKQNQAELETLKAQVSQMRETNQNLSMSISAAFLMMRHNQSAGHEAVFDGNKPGGFVRLNTDSGFFGYSRFFVADTFKIGGRFEEAG
jgi:hypothetical protein